MSTGVVAAGAAAVALYVYIKQKAFQDGSAMEPVLPVEVTRNAPDHAPSNWGEALYHVKEVLRYMYNETFARWHTIDLFVGLAYLSHREAVEYPAADIAAKGVPIGVDLGTEERLKLLLELQEARRYMLYCKGLKLRREDMQARFWREHLGADSLTLLRQQATAGVLRPAYVVVADHLLRCIVLCVRGTHSMKDLFTSLAGAAKPHHVVDPLTGQLVLGWSHLGMLAAARWLARQVAPLLRGALREHPGYQLRIVGHSMGGGTAVLLTMMLRGGYMCGGGGEGEAGTAATASDRVPTGSSASSCPPSPSPAAAPSPPSPPSSPSPEPHPPTSTSPTSPDPFLDARCFAIACPCLLTAELAACCRPYVTSLVNGTDIVPTFCAASVDALREDVTRSAWFTEFSRDMRSGVVRALQGGVRGVGSATQWTSRNILAPAVGPFRACYATTTTRRIKRRTASSASLASSTSSSSLFSCGPLTTATTTTLTAVEQQYEQQTILAGTLGAGPGPGQGPGGGVAFPAAYTAATTTATATSFSATTTTLVGAAAAALPPRAQAMTSSSRGPMGQDLGSAGDGGSGGLDERAMAEAVQSCMYAVESAVTAQQGATSATDPALAEALGLLESLPRELGAGSSSIRGAAAHGAAGNHHHQHPHHLHSQHHHRPQRDDVRMVEPREEEEQADSL
ncbi:hypothetical protein Agub_g2737, partial [Astrephomene gubernaculifera]